MFWGPPTLPLTGEQKEWIEKSFHGLLQEFGEKYFVERPMILPELKYFPDKYDGSDDSVIKLVEHLCSFMDVNPELVEVDFFFDRDDTAEKHRTGNMGQPSGAAGLYFSQATGESRRKIAINVSQLKNPTGLVATIAHELGHVILLGGGKISRDNPDHEYLTDLITVFFGLGVFTANAAFQFSQWRDHSHSGWSASRSGYLSEAMFAYSLALYAWMRGDTNPQWRGHLAMNVGAHFKRCLKYLNKGGPTTVRQLVQPPFR